MISRFLNNEPKHLEPILEAFENLSNRAIGSAVSNDPSTVPFTWEEHYVLLLWLSHLLLTPFDLSSIGSSTLPNQHGESQALPEGLHLASNSPIISKRLVKIAADHLTAATKEREAATTMLVRLALRPDMRELGFHEVLIRWAVEQLKDRQSLEASSSHQEIGALSFLANVIKSADAGETAPFLLYIFTSVKKLNALHSEKYSGLSRKAVIKIYCASCVSSIQKDNNGSNDNSTSNVTNLLLEEAVDDLLTALGDTDTPVRQAASKALSIITMKLDPSLAADISEAVINGLNENVFWESIPELSENGSHQPNMKTIRRRNLTAVDHLKWQGFVLTLSHLLYRRCAPATLLPGILNSLILALGFEQRSRSGASSGSNVRDAACFGIWAVARRYSTSELIGIDVQSMAAAQERVQTHSVLQLLAVELVVAATTDPSGNIRRGASAALQELVGRHPDTVKCGISLVQIVDYHAVALRSKAMKDVASRAAGLAQDYWQALLQEMCTWRGIGAIDVESRRLAAETIGIFSTFEGVESLRAVTKALWQSLNALDGGSVQKRQGFLLSLAAIVGTWGKLGFNGPVEAKLLLEKYWDVFSDGFFLSETDFTSTTARPELVAEGAAALMFELATATGSQMKLSHPSKDLLQISFKYLNRALERRESLILNSGGRAAKALLEVSDEEQRQDWIKQAIARCLVQQTKTIGGQGGFLIALGSAYSVNDLTKIIKMDLLNTILDAAEVSRGIDVRVIALSCISRIIHSGCSK